MPSFEMEPLLCAGGVTQLIMPLIYTGIKQSGRPGFTAWRWAFMVPGSMFLLLAILVLLFSQDTPNGSYRDLRKTRVAQVDSKKTLIVGLKNYRLVHSMQMHANAVQ